MGHVPYVIEGNNEKEKSYDLYSRLLKDRIIFLGEVVGTDLANSIVAQFLFLESQDSESDIYLYINSPGGSVSAGLAIYDVMNFVKADVCTVCYGVAMSMGSLLLSSGAKGKRYALPNSSILIHQPLGGFEGQVSDMKIQFDRISSLKEKLFNIYVENTGQPYDTVEKDCDRDNYMTPEEALKYGLIDEIKNIRK